MTFNIDDLPTLDPLNPHDQDLMVAISAALSGDGVGNYPNVLELVRNFGSKEAAYEALLVNHPRLPEELSNLRLFMGMACKAERELTGCN